MNLLTRAYQGMRNLFAPPAALAKIDEIANRPNDEQGRRTNDDNYLNAIYRGMWVDPELRASIYDVRRMDKLDGRVKRIHNKIATDTVRGGLLLTMPVEDARVRAEWEAFVDRLSLDRPGKLKSDARLFAMQGNLPMQWVLDEAGNVVLGVAMPAETFTPITDMNGRFKDVRRAWKQVSMQTGETLAEFPLWKLTMARLDPDSYDDLGAMGRPFLDASRTGWQKLTMSEEDLVIRRRTRAPQKLSHVLEGASPEEIATYRAEVEKNASDITTDYYSNKKGGVTVIQGDAQMGEIKDVVHLLDTWFAGSPVLKFLLGYTEGLARDVLEDLKRNYYDDIDHLQDEIAYVYNEGFELHLLLKGINPETAGYCVEFAERRTETPTQTTDRMLKWQALGIPPDMTFEEMGLDPAKVAARREKWDKDHIDPYPDGAGGDQTPKPNVSITPGNGRKGDSGTAITSQ